MSDTQFECCVCNISLPIQYQGTNPPFLPGVLYSIYFIIHFSFYSFKEEELPAVMDKFATLLGSGTSLPEELDIIKFIF